MHCYPGGSAFAPSADQVAKRVYSNYGNQSSLPGLELHRWLEAEAQLLAVHSPDLRFA
jgi:hypothetical protein